MAFTVVLDGKPCVGKTTQATLVAQNLRERGINAVGIKDCIRSHPIALDIMNVSGKIRQRSQGGMLEQGIVYSLSVAAVAYSFLSARRKNFDVVIFEGTPLIARAYAFGDGDYMGSGARVTATYKVIGAAAKFFPIDMLVYLSASKEALLERFETREDNKDVVHRRELELDDALHKHVLECFVGTERFECVDSGKASEDVADDITGRVLLGMRRGGGHSRQVNL